MSLIPRNMRGRERGDHVSILMENMARRFLLFILMAFLSIAAARAAGSVDVLTIDGAIGPAAADYVRRGILHAQDSGAQLVVLQMDTPGGLDTSMRTIIKAMLASPVPVAVYVSPSGARAASAGTYILYASHIAAMAPGTNLGAATPVRLGAPGSGDEGDKAQPKRQDKDDSGKDKDRDIPGEAITEPMTRKQVNDAAAYIRGLAQLRGRNIEWAEKAVRQAVSLSADEALKLNVIDLVARDLQSLLARIDGKEVTLDGGTRRLQTANAEVIRHPPDWRTRFLAVITDPGIALILMTIGIYGLIFEFMNPGFGVPGVLGGICVVLALYALQLLPVNYAGLALILLGLGFMVAEAFLPSFGVLGIGGIAAFVTGAIILIDTELPGFGIPIGLIVGIAITSALLIAAVIGMALKSRKLAVVTGSEQLIGSPGQVIEATPAVAWAYIHGERWQVTSKLPLQRGQKVRVIGRNGLVLEVEPIDK